MGRTRSRMGGSLLLLLLFGYVLGEEVLSLPEKMVDLKSGEITRENLVSVPQLIVVANRDAYKIIEESYEVANYPEHTIWVPNIFAAPGFVLRLFIKPALVKTAEKVEVRVMYDGEGDWARGLGVVSEEGDYLAVFYADSEGVRKVMEERIPKKQYKQDEAKQALVKKMVSLWQEAGEN